MKKYHAYRRELYRSQKGCMGYPHGDPLRPQLLNVEGSKEKLLALLDEAEKIAKGDVLKHRLSRDRKWLTEYWIKPNEKARYEAAHAIVVPRTTASVTVDGDPSDAAWKGAAVIEDRFRLEREIAKFRKPVPASMKTSVRMLRDDENLYFLCLADEADLAHLRVTAKKPDESAWGDDCFEIMLYPPAIENRYYHIAVNSIGTVYDARCPGNDATYNLGVVAKGGRTPTGWCVELKVPSKNLYPIVGGEKWRFQIGRGRPGEHPETITLDGYISHDTANFPSFELGK